MKEFIDKCKNDPKLKNKIQIGAYILFFVLIAIYAFGGGHYDVPTEQTKNTYKYKMNININDNIYTYEGEKTKEKVIINKIVDETTIQYEYIGNKYYKIEENKYIETTKDEIYDTIEFSYLSLDTIEKYWIISKEKDTEKVIYLKDIIMGSDSEEYIVIQKEGNTYNIDYTALMKLFNKNIEKLMVEIIIE